MHSANLQLTAKTMRLKTPYRLYPKEQEPRRCPNSQKRLLLTKEPAAATGCDSKVLRLSTPNLFVSFQQCEVCWLLLLQILSFFKLC